MTRTNLMLILSAMLVFATALVGYGDENADLNQNYAPLVFEARALPAIIEQGEIATFGAIVVDANGDEDIQAVGLYVFVNEDPVLLRRMRKDELPHVYRCRIEVPEILPAGRYDFFIIAIDQAGEKSIPKRVTLTVVPHTAKIPNLKSPENGYEFDCEESPLLAWTIVRNGIGYQVEIGLDQHNHFIFEVPMFVTSLKVDMRIWQYLPDGRYVWRVRALTMDGPTPWSSIGYFYKNCQGEEEPGDQQ